MLLRRHREAPVKASTPIKELDLIEDDKKGLENPRNTDPSGTGDPGNTDPSGTGDPGQDGGSDPALGAPVNYDGMIYDDLKALAKEKGIPYASVKKADLIEALKASK